jgi:RNA polymerase sigma-70 factor (ECF subfamily)
MLIKTCAVDILGVDNLENLIQRSRSGDTEAFNEIVRRYYAVTYGMAYRMLGIREEAEDATQEIFFLAWKHLQKFRGSARFTTWLHSIAVNHCLNVSRKRKREADYREKRSDFDEAFQDRVILLHSFNFDPGQWALNQAIQDAFLRLPESLRTVLALRYYSEYSVEEIGQALNLNPRTVRSRIFLGIKRLRLKFIDAEGKGCL